MFGKRERPIEKFLSIPDFTALTGQAVGTLVESNEVTVTADNAWVFSALIRGGDAEFNVNGTGWVKNAAFRNGDTIKLRATTSGDSLTETVINLYAQSANKEWSITTSEITDWTPAELFTAGEQGVWYDPSDLTTIFQDTFGSTPVTAAGQTVALMLDKSQGLAQGEATTATGWVNAGFGSFSTDGTSVTFEKTVAGGTDQTYSSAQFAVTAGTRYEIELDVSQYFGGFAVFFSFTTNSRGEGFNVSSGGVQKFFLIPSATATLSLNFRTTSLGGGASVSVASVREAPLGNHATQATAASRPVYAYHPEGGIRNLLIRTEEFDDAAWFKVNSTFASGVLTATIDGGKLQQNITVPAGSSFFFDVMQGTATTVILDNGLAGANDATDFNLVDQTVTVRANNESASITDLGGGVLRLQVTRGATTGNRVSLNIPTSGQTVLPVRAQLELSPTATNYQRVGNEYDVTEAGVASLSYLSFDGAGDHMVASYGSTFSELTRAFAYRTNDQGFIGDDNDTVNEGSLYAIADGDLRLGISGAGGNNSIIASGGWNWGINSVAVASVSSTKEMRLTGSGNDATPLTAAAELTGLSGITVGAAAGGLISLDGRIYNAIDVDRVVTTQERDSLTTYLAQKSGVTL